MYTFVTAVMAFVGLCKTPLPKALNRNIKFNLLRAKGSCSCGPKNSRDTEQTNSDKKFPEPLLITLETPEDIRKKVLGRCRIVVQGHDTYELINGRPLEFIKTRRARIHQPTKNVQQQGTGNLGHWVIDLNSEERWENPLMGWCSSGDPLSNLEINFSTKEEAITFCQMNKLPYWIQESKTHKKFRVKSYALNFHHNRRTRVSTR